MKTTLLALSLSLLLSLCACSHGKDLAQVASQENYGVQAAKMNLWREALFRFQRAVQIKPDDALAHSNLAVAWEANGNLENARKEYLIALNLDKSNQFIQKNYSRFVEFTSRNKKRQGKTAAPAKAAASPAPLIPPAGMPTAERGTATPPPPLPGTLPPAEQPQDPRPNPPGGVH